MELTVTSVDVDVLNSEEAMKIQEQMREQTMRDREALEVTRMNEVQDIINGNDVRRTELASLDSQIQFLLDMNKGDIPEEEKKSNKEAISGYRDSYF
jgi:polyhydroxyalkanoate synthesis regulator phasin